MSRLHQLARRVARRLLGVTSRTATGLLALVVAGAAVATVVVATNQSSKPEQTTTGVTLHTL